MCLPRGVNVSAHVEHLAASLSQALAEQGWREPDGAHGVDAAQGRAGLVWWLLLEVEQRAREAREADQGAV